MAIVALAVLVGGGLFLGTALPSHASAAAAGKCVNSSTGVDECIILNVNLSGSGIPSSGITVTAKRVVQPSGLTDNSVTLTKSSTTSYTSKYGIYNVRPGYWAGQTSCADPTGIADGAGDTNTTVATFNITVTQGGKQIGSLSNVDLCSGTSGPSSGYTFSKTVSVAVTPSGQTSSKGGIKGTASWENSLTDPSTGKCATNSFIEVLDGPDKLNTQNEKQFKIDGGGTYTTDLTLKPGSGYTVELTCFDNASNQGNGAYTATKKNITVKAGAYTTVDFNNTQSASAGGGTDSGSGDCADGSDADASGDCATSDSSTLDCASGALNWIVCPLTTLLQKTASGLDNLIMSQLNVNTDNIFSGDNADSYHAAWSAFRTFAVAVIVIAGLVMVASQAFGLEILDAYTIRKTLPRLFVAIIGISLSWPILKFTIELFDTIGYDIRNVIYAPFNNMAGVSIGAGLGATIIGGLVTAGMLFVYGPAVLTFLGAAFLAALVAFLVLIVRQVGVILLLILAPFAIACYVLPNTQRIWKLWYDNFLGLMLMFPIISGFIAAGHVFAAVASTGGIFEQFVAIIAYFIPYFMLPFAFRLATGAIATIAGMANDRSKGAFDRLRGFRQKAAGQRHQMRVAGQTKFGSSWAGKNIYRRGALMGTPNSGALSFSKQGRANFAEANRSILAHTSGEVLKNDNMRAAGDDDAMAAAFQAKSANDFIAKYQARGHSEAEARSALALTQSSFGTTMGSSAMKSAAFQARAASVTGYSGDDAGVSELYKDAATAVNAGIMTTNDAAAAIKANKARGDQSGIGFGDSLNQISRTAERLKSGETDMSKLVTHDEIHGAKGLRQSALDGSLPGSLISQRKEAVQAMVPHMRDNLQAAMSNISDVREKVARGERKPNGQLYTADDHANAVRDFKQQLASVAGMYDAMSQISPQNARIMADGLMGQGLVTTDIPELGLAANNGGAGGVTVQSAIEGLRIDSTFQEMRREYGSSAAQQASQLQQQQGDNPIARIGG